jgi:hypothetical protein
LALRFSSGSFRKSSPFNSSKSKAYKNTSSGYARECNSAKSVTPSLPEIHPFWRVAASLAAAA